MSGRLLFASGPFKEGTGSQRWIAAGRPGAIGIRLIWAQLSQRVAQICWALLAAHLYLGGGEIAGARQLREAGQESIVMLLGTGLAVGKAVLLLVGLSALSRLIPALRSDQAHEFSWRVLSPLALMALLLGRVFSGGL